MSDPNRMTEGSATARDRYAALLDRLRDMPEDEPMTATPADLIERAFVEIFQERDAAARRRAIDELFAPEIVFRDPEGEAHGIPDAAAQIDALIAGMDPAWTFRSVTPPVQLGDLAIHRWELGPQSTAVVTGTDVVFVADGKIAKFYIPVN